jgi:hypothetical protein
MYIDDAARQKETNVRNDPANKGTLKRFFENISGTNTNTFLAH